MEPFYNALHNFDISQVKITDPTDNLYNIITTNSSYSFFKKFTKERVDYCGDILVGFYAETDTTFDVQIRATDFELYTVATHTLKAGEFTFAFENTFIPYISLNPLRVFVSSPVYAIYAHIDTEQRKFIAHNTFYIKNYSFGDGKFKVNSNPNTLPTFKLKGKFDKVMEPFYNALHTFDINQVKNTNKNDSLSELIQTNSSYSFYKCKEQGKITSGANADVLVGFYSDTDTTFTLTIDGIDIVTHTLKAGQFVFGLNGTIIPWIGIGTEEGAYVSSPVYVIYANLDTELRKFVCTALTCIGDYIVGLGERVIKINEDYYKYPTFQVKENVDKKRKYEDIIRIDC